MLRRAATLATGLAARAVGPRTFAPAVSYVPHLPIFDQRKNEIAGTRGATPFRAALILRESVYQEKDRG